MNKSGILTNSKSNPKTLSKQGKLPAGWKTVRFGDVVKDVKESEKNPLEAGLDRYIGLEHIEPENLHIKQWGNLNEDQVSFTKRFRKGQVLFGKRRAYQRKVAVAEFDGICSSDILTFEPKGDDLLPELLPFIVQSDTFFEHALDTSSGSLSPRTRWSQLKDYKFLLPPKLIQKQISEILYSAIQAHETIFQVKNDLLKSKSAVFNQLLINEECLQIRIAELGQVITGATPPTKNQENFDGDFMFVTPADIGESMELACTERSLSSQGLNSVRPIPPGSVMVVCIGSTIGKVAMNLTRCASNQQINTVVCNESYDSRFVYYLMKRMSSFFAQQAACTAVPILNKQEFSSILVSVPTSLEAQKRITSIMQVFEQTEKQINAYLCYINRLFSATREMILKQRVWKNVQ